MQSWRIWLILLTFLLLSFFLGQWLPCWGLLLISKHSKAKIWKTNNTFTQVLREKYLVFSAFPVSKGYSLSYFSIIYINTPHVHLFLEAIQILGLNSSCSFPSFHETSSKTADFPGTHTQWQKLNLYTCTHFQRKREIISSKSSLSSYLPANLWLNTEVNT